jgi:hypothetical protein
MDRVEIVAGLRAGRTLCIDRRDAPELLIVNDLVIEGIAQTELVQIDEQSSVLKVTAATH